MPTITAKVTPIIVPTSSPVLKAANASDAKNSSSEHAPHSKHASVASRSLVPPGKDEK